MNTKPRREEGTRGHAKTTKDLKRLLFASIRARKRAESPIRMPSLRDIKQRITASRSGFLLGARECRIPARQVFVNKIASLQQAVAWGCRGTLSV